MSLLQNTLLTCERMTEADYALNCFDKVLYINS